jgi:Rrf2 family protein
MKISEGVEWGAHCLVLLAALPPQVIVPARAMAEYHGISEAYLVKHLQAMATAGLVESMPGPKGGYRLVRAPEQITMLDVVEAIEGREPAFRCTEIRQRGPAAVEPAAYRVPCSIHATMLRAEKAWRDQLRAQTIADLVAQMARTADPRSIAATEVWLPPRIRSGGPFRTENEHVDS